MAERITEETVRSVLTWARNYQEIESFKEVARRGRRWEVTLPEPRIVGPPLNILNEILGIRPRDVVPPVMVFTGREALAFGYGCAAGGIHDRSVFAREEWGW